MMATTTTSPRARRAHAETHVGSSGRSRAYSENDSTVESRHDPRIEDGTAEARRRELRVVRPEAARTSRTARRAVLIGPVLVLVTLLGVAGAQAFLTEGQARLTNLQAEVAAAQTKRLDLELQIADEEQPAAVMAAARQLGLVAPLKISDLPAVALPAGSPPKTTTSGSGKGSRHGDGQGAGTTSGKGSTRGTGSGSGAPGAP